MLNIKFIRENREKVKENCKLRNFDCDIDKLLELNEERIKLGTEFDELQHKKNKLNDEIRNTESEEEKKKIIEEGQAIKRKYVEVAGKFKGTNIKYNDLLNRIPNMTHPDSPIGKDDSENKEIERYGEPPKFAFEPKGHEELMKSLDLIDFERGAKVAGSKFYFLKNEAVLLGASFDSICTGFLS